MIETAVSVSMAVLPSGQVEGRTQHSVSGKDLMFLPLVLRVPG